MPPTPAESAKTFISYARADSEFALNLADELRAAGASIWIDELVAPGTRWDRVVEGALKICARLLIVLSPASVSYALENGKTVIQLLYRDCEIPLRFHRIQRVDVRAGAAGLLAVLGIQSPVTHQARTLRTNPKDGLGYVWIPPGEFLMGACPDVDEATVNLFSFGVCPWV